MKHNTTAIRPARPMGPLRRFGATLMLALPVVARGQFTYTTNNDFIIITGYSGGGGSVTIPPTIDGLPVRVIGSWAFANVANVTNITLPDGVSRISEDAFRECGNLRSIALPNSISYIGRTAFHSCISLTNITIPGSVDSIQDSTFSACSSLATVTTALLTMTQREAGGAECG